jgi:2-dehydro-3-deoxygluconokinase
MTSVLCVGEPLISLTPTFGGPLSNADQLTVSTGGAELNVAMHLAQLGVPARFAGRVGDDPFGLRLRRTLDGGDVDTRYLESDPHHPTGIYVKDPQGDATLMLYYRRGSAATTYDRVPDEALRDVSRIHLTGITPALSTSCRSLVTGLLSGSGYETSFDINFRAALWRPEEAAPILLDLARRARTVFVGLDEAEALWGCITADDVRALLSEPTELVVKDGPRPAHAFVEDVAVTVAARPVDVVEPVGAGDAFAAGYLAARYFALDPKAALGWGHRLAESVLRVRGDHTQSHHHETLLDDFRPAKDR